MFFFFLFHFSFSLLPLFLLKLLSEGYKSSWTEWNNRDPVLDVGDTYSGEGVVQVVNGPRYDYNVVNVKPEGQDGCCKAHTYHTDMN